MPLGSNLRYQGLRVTFAKEKEMVTGRGFEPRTHGFSVRIIYASHCALPSYTGIYCKSLTL